MPIYEYQCKKCGFEFEMFVLSSEEKTKCPKCSSENVEKLISAPNLGINYSGSSYSSCGGNKSGLS